MPRVVVAVTEEDDEVEGVSRFRQVLDQRRACRALAVEPGEFIGERVRLLEDSTRSASELERLPFMRNWKASDRNAVDVLDAGGQLVAPRDVIARAGRDDFDLRVPGQPLGNVARVQLRSAVDVGAVALGDDRELHESRDSSPASPLSSDASNGLGLAPPRVRSGLARRRRPADPIPRPGTPLAPRRRRPRRRRRRGSPLRGVSLTGC